MPAPFSGGCACGAIRYECSADPLVIVNCHCRDCQRASGGTYASAVVVLDASLTLLKGEPKHYVSKADSGSTVRRGFCAECGSPLFAGNTVHPEVLAIKVGSVDDPSWCSPMVDIWTASAQPWDYMNPELPKFPQQPPGS